MLEDNGYLKVTDLKQYAYCPRVVFYEYCLPHVRPRTYKMDAGRDAHENEQRLAMRRSLAKYGLPQGERRFDVRISSGNLRLNSEIDEVIYTPDNTTIPVDYKLAKQVSQHHRVQVCAYGLLLEDEAQNKVTYGYIYLIPSRKLVRIDLTEKLRLETHTILDQLQKMVEDEQIPSPLAESKRGACASCEFRRFCNDI